MAAGKASIMVMALIMVAGLLTSASAVKHTLTWTFADNSTQYDEWASRQNFVVGDEIAFVYDSTAHDVYEVSESDLKSCNLNAPINKYVESNAVVTLDRSGYFGFICGFSGHCVVPGNMKMNVQVLAASTPTAPPSVAPGSAPSLLPVVPPASPTTPRPMLSPLPSPPLFPSAPTPGVASDLQTRSAMVVGVLLAACAAVLL